MAKLATFGSAAAAKQEKAASGGSGGEARTGVANTGDDPLLTDATVEANCQPPPVATMIRNIAFTAQEQQILTKLMDHLRGAGELTPNLSLAVKVGLRLIPASVSQDSLRSALDACKALDRRRKGSKQNANVAKR